MDIEELRKLLSGVINEYHNTGIGDFEGYSPVEMRGIFYEPFGERSPVQFHKLSEQDYGRIPLLKQIRYLAGLVAEAGGIRLTGKGFLPTRTVADICAQGFIRDEFVESGMYKLYKETDSMSVHLTRILIELTGLAKKRNGKLSLTRKAEKILSDQSESLKLVFTTFASKFNWTYFDGYGNNGIGQMGWCFSLILLSKYGRERRQDSFYAEKYFRAFPTLMKEVKPGFRTSESTGYGCYSIRTFDRFLDFFGLIRIDREGKRWDAVKYITRTALFDRLFSITPPGNPAGL
ncbi:MAG: hypothetical protein JXA03_09290 [Bacteroidales bacterium]|nr:hypothetical protein [Bacteroidales bacterium]